LNKENQTILVAGGAGFIGTHLCHKLLDIGFSVICIDNFYTGHISNIENLIKNTKFKLINHDVRYKIDIDHIDMIFNLASPASPCHYIKDPIYTLNTNVIGTNHLLELALKHKAIFIQASTSEVYGDPLEHPQSEDYFGNVNHLGPRGCYDEGKRCAETLVFEYHRVYNLDSRIVRIFNTYGPFMQKNDGRVISNFICNAIEDKPLMIYGDGSQSRSFCYIDDLIEGLIQIVDIKFNNPINLGNNQELTVLDLAKMIIHQTGSKSCIEFSELPINDPKRRNPDLKIAKNLIDWNPKIPLEVGLNKTIDFFKGFL
jgi:UDP-glucuronate decarboxylase